MMSPLADAASCGAKWKRERDCEVDAAVREGLRRAKSTAAAAIFTTGGKYAFKYPNVMVCAYARQAWREQHA